MLGRRRGVRGQLIWSMCILLYAVVHLSLQEANNTDATEPTFEEEPKHSVVPTWRPKRENCTPPAIEQFPRPLIGPWGRKHGAIIIHVIVCVYSFIGLAIICDEYFVTSLDRICEVLKLSPDVAGATFMAAGSSAPELATVVIGVFFAKDDIGVSGVIGSAVFNIMFVISVCAIFAGTVCYLNWWPLCRDSFFYSVSILAMLIVIFDDKISWAESLVMLFLYVGYCVALSFNKALEAWAGTLPIPCLQQLQANEAQRLMGVGKTTYNSEGTTEALANGGGGGETYHPPAAPTSWEEQMEEGGPPPPTSPPPTTTGPQPGLPNPRPEYYKAKEPPTDQVSPLVRPETENKLILYQWYLYYPIHYLAKATMPDCRTEKYANWYPFTFLISMIWISFYSYIMVWMITIIGSTLGIPDTVMGLTFVAAGVSVPDALSSLAVVKEGYGDMAVSNAVGSNVFDILVCLGLPWFIQTALIKPGSHVNVYSKGLTYSTLTLLSTVAFLLIATHMNGWKLDKKYGIILMVWYILFICFASLYELNVFGYMNPPECPSNY